MTTTASKTDRTATLNRICAVLMLCLVVLQFLPFWSYPIEGGTARSSIQGYIWFPSDHPDLLAALQAELGAEFRVNDVVGMPVLVLLTGVVGFFTCLACSNQRIVSLLPLACGLSACYGYLFNPAFRFSSLWILHFLFALLIFAAALCNLIPVIISRLKR